MFYFTLKGSFSEPLKLSSVSKCSELRRWAGNAPPPTLMASLVGTNWLFKWVLFVFKALSSDKRGQMVESHLVLYHGNFSLSALLEPTFWPTCWSSERKVVPLRRENEKNGLRRFLKGCSRPSWKENAVTWMCCEDRPLPYWEQDSFIPVLYVKAALCNFCRGSSAFLLPKA